MKKIKRFEIIRSREKYDRSLRLPYAEFIESEVVDLYPINEDTIIPGEALDPERWEIPEGYYAIKRDLD